MVLLKLLVLAVAAAASADPSSATFDFNSDFNYANIKDDVYEQPVELMNQAPKKTAHMKAEPPATEQQQPVQDSWAPFDFSKFDAYLSSYQDDDARDHNRLKRRAKRRRGRGGRRRNRNKQTTAAPDDSDHERGKNASAEVPIARKGENHNLRQGKSSRSRKGKNSYDNYEPKIMEYESDFVEMPKDLYQAHLRPGVIFRIHMSEAIIKMQYRNYGEDKDESVIEADVEYLRLTRKVINDEITKFEDLKWLVGWFNNRSSLIQNHMCNTRYFTVDKAYGSTFRPYTLVFFRSSELAHHRTTGVISDCLDHSETLEQGGSYRQMAARICSVLMTTLKNSTDISIVFRVSAVDSGIPPTMWTHSEEYMKRMCLFDNIYIDHIPYVVGEDSSLMAAVAPPVLHCDAATCTSVPFIDSVMFDERLPRTNVRTVTRCQASCRAHCRNDPDCLKRCSDRCLRAEKK